MYITVCGPAKVRQWPCRLTNTPTSILRMTFRPSLSRCSWVWSETGLTTANLHEHRVSHSAWMLNMLAVPHYEHGTLYFDGLVKMDAAGTSRNSLRFAHCIRCCIWRRCKRQYEKGCHQGKQPKACIQRHTRVRHRPSAHGSALAAPQVQCIDQPLLTTWAQPVADRSPKFAG
jgi:hypothetical protein